MLKQDKRYFKIKKKTVEVTEEKTKKELKLWQKILVITILFFSCIGAIIGLVFLLMYKFHS